MEWKKKPTRRASLLLAIAALALPLFFMSCGDDYEKPSTTQTPTALISAETLKEWIDAGKVNGTGYDRVVILTVTTPGSYAASHIPGALLWSANPNELHMIRLEGLAEIPTMVLDGSSMDTILQRSGIDRRTTIVLSHTSGSMMNQARTYFTLRYWGFPRERIKMLNGGDTAWAAAVTANVWDAETYGLTAAVPAISPSSFSVRENRVLRSDLRLSLGEMLQEVDRNIADTSTVKNILDTRGGTDYESTTLPAGYSFQGHIANAIKDDHAQYYSGTGFKSREDLETYLLTTLSVDPGKKFIVYCVSGMRASTVFAVLDGIFGWDVAMYDGSWQQWAKYGDRASDKPNDAWRTDLNSRSVINSATGNSDLVIDPLLNAIYQDASIPTANQIEREDAEYMSAGGDEPGGGGGSGTPSGC